MGCEVTLLLGNPIVASISHKIAYDVAVFSSSAPFSRSPHAVPACALWFPTERTDGFDEKYIYLFKGNSECVSI